MRNAGDILKSTPREIVHVAPTVTVFDALACNRSSSN